MATLNSLSVTTTSGETFLLQLSSVILFYDNSNSKAVVTFFKTSDVTTTATLTISSATLRTNLNTTFLKSVTKITGQGNKTVYINVKRIVTVITNTTGSQIQYSDGFTSPTPTWNLTDSAATVAALYARLIKVNHEQSGTVFYISADYVVDAATNSLTKTNELQTATVVAAGASYAVGDLITLDCITGSGGTNPILEVDTTQLISTSVNAAGSSYNIGDKILTAGGTASTHATLKVTHIKAVTAPIVAVGGSGYVTGDHVSLTTGTGTQAIFTVTASAGAVTSLSAIFNAGDYTVRPTIGATEATTAVSGVGTGLTVAVIAADFGVKTTSVFAAGSYTVESASLTQNTTTGSGTGATFNTAVYGVLTTSVSDDGIVPIVPTNPVSQLSTTGGGTGATFDCDFALGTDSGTTIYVNDTIGTEPKQYNVEETLAQVQTLLA